MKFIIEQELAQKLLNYITVQSVPKISFGEVAALVKSLQTLKQIDTSVE